VCEKTLMSTRGSSSASSRLSGPLLENTLKLCMRRLVCHCQDTLAAMNSHVEVLSTLYDAVLL
jgi:hypothetical protein